MAKILNAENDPSGEQLRMEVLEILHRLEDLPTIDGRPADEILG